MALNTFERHPNILEISFDFLQRRGVLATRNLFQHGVDIDNRMADPNLRSQADLVVLVRPKQLGEDDSPPARIRLRCKGDDRFSTIPSLALPNLSQLI